MYLRFITMAVMQDAGCQCAYNLGGGGSSTMWFMGDVVNNPTTNGNSISERKVSEYLKINTKHNSQKYKKILCNFVNCA